jgi:hypothetical protein
MDILFFELKVTTTIETIVIAPERPPTKIYTTSPPREPIRICQADRVETDSGNYDLSMAKVKPVLTLNQGEVKELNFLAQQAQQLQISPHDFSHAMIMITPEQVHDPPNITGRPLLLAAANVDRLRDEHHEQVTHHPGSEIRPQHTQLITPIPEHMAKVEQDIAVFENVSSTNIVPPSHNRLNEVPHDSGIVSLNTSQASEQPLILNVSRINRLETMEEQRLENLHEDEYYRRRLRAMDLLRNVETDPDFNIQPVRHTPAEIYDYTMVIPPANVPTAQTRVLDSHQIGRLEPVERTDAPVIYETIDQEIIQRIPPQEQVISSDVRQNNETRNRAERNEIQWGQPIPVRQHHSEQRELTDTRYEYTRPFDSNQPVPRENLRPTEEPLPPLLTHQQYDQSIVYNYGE